VGYLVWIKGATPAHAKWFKKDANHCIIKLAIVYK
jgi:hypothetical protein